MPPALSDASGFRRAAQLYRARAFQPIWSGDAVGGAGAESAARRRSLIDALAGAHEHGIRRSRYPLRAVADAVDEVSRANDAEALAHAEIVLTSVLASYANDLLAGIVDPRRIEASWHIRERNNGIDSILQHFADASEPSRVLADLRPHEDGYEALMLALARYRAVAEQGGWPVVPTTGTLRVGDSTPVMPVLRERLRAEGFDAPMQLDSLMQRFTASDSAAVLAFQERHGLEADGIVGPHTRSALNVSATRRAQQIAANLERYRWLPRELGERRIVVNIPAFRLDAYDRDRLALSMRVVVGDELASRRTPVFSDEMSYVQFGPFWNVPRSIAVKEVLPEVRKDRSYLARNNFELVRGWGDNAPPVDVYSLSDAELFSTRYRVRQRPGADNALGRVKFMFPNDFHVYLHDTPAKSLFDHRHRAYSHGCVRVAEPFALAEFVLQDREEWNTTRIAAAIADGTRTRVTLPRKIPVYLIYLTAFAQDGVVAFRDDLYNRDDRVLDAIGSLEESPSTRSAIASLQAIVR